MWADTSRVRVRGSLQSGPRDDSMFYSGVRRGRWGFLTEGSLQSGTAESRHGGGRRSVSHCRRGVR
jgi:hypothetical protein